MTNKPNGVLYIGVTDDIHSRVVEHKVKFYPKSFTAKYNCDKLIYFEEFSEVAEASKRERQFKKWKRDWKINLIKETNNFGYHLELYFLLIDQQFRTKNLLV